MDLQLVETCEGDDTCWVCPNCESLMFGDGYPYSRGDEVDCDECLEMFEIE